MLPPGDSSQSLRQLQAQSKEIEDDTPGKWQPKESGCSHTYIRQNRLQAKKDNKRQKWIVYNDKEDNSSRRHNVINIYAPNTGAPKYIKQLLTDLKGEIDSNTIIVGEFSSPLASWIDHPDRKSTRKQQP